MIPVTKRLKVIAHEDGLFLQPIGSRFHGAYLIAYGTENKNVFNVPSLQHERGATSIESHGLVGLFHVGPSRFLIAITGREEVAQINGKPVYVITKIAIIPLGSAADAKKAVQQAKAPRSGAEESDEEASSEDETQKHPSRRSEDTLEEDHGVTTPARPDPEASLIPGSSVARDVIGRRGQYGRFAERWFSRNGWVPETGKVQDAATSTLQAVGSFTGITRSGEDPQPAEVKPASREETPQIAVSMLPKLLKTMEMMLCSKSFYFAYDLDLTRRLGTQLRKDAGLSLHKIVDPLFFWNRHLSLELIESGLHTLVLPIMQGFVGQREFAIPWQSAEAAPIPIAAGSSSAKKTQDAAATKESAEDLRLFNMTLISRRSIKRSGLRYLRRGIDEEGNAANTVETEQILSMSVDDGKSKDLSFTQLRGSIPLFFSQSPYSFKPTPVMHHSSELNAAALRRHFQFVRDRYGQVMVSLLTDKKGFEAPIGKAYEDQVRRLNEKQERSGGAHIGFEWFAFHEECRGMKFENVSKLVSTLDPALTKLGDTREEGGKIESTQSGICRTNCMDCLDRTNVTQSALGRHMLRKQLEHLGAPPIDLQFGDHSRWFNTLWADNGDAISKQYASTAALKGDYTRTSKRNYQGALNDFSLTLSRYYSNVVNDFFAQTVIDYLLGNVTDAIFEDFEANLMSADPGISVSKMRQHAIDASVKIVIEDPETEELRGGWVVLTPSRNSTLRTLPLEEVVLLITDQALYAVRFDWGTDKVESFERVALESVTDVQRGTYITSTFSSADTNAERNVGFVVRYRPGKAHIARVNTRSMSTAVDPKKLPEAVPDKKADKGRKGEGQFLAFKAPRDRSAIAGASGSREREHPVSETALVENICDELARAEGRLSVETSDIISLEEAKKAVGILEQVGNSLKRFIWA